MSGAKKSDETVGCLAMIAALIFGGYWLWQRAYETGWVWHDTLALVMAKNWSTGEYKNCSEPNVAVMKDEPQLDCSNSAEYEEPKRFKVRFYGLSYRDELKDKVSFAWRCVKNEGTDPAFTCDDQKIIRWSETK